MKRDLSNLTEAHIKGIRRWLDSHYKWRFCPFHWEWEKHCERITCRAIFPKLPKYLCPCNQYSLSYVTRIAKEIVKEWEAP